MPIVVNSIAIKDDGQHCSEGLNQNELKHALLHSAEEYPKTTVNILIEYLLVSLERLESIQRPRLLYSPLERIS